MESRKEEKEEEIMDSPILYPYCDFDFDEWNPVQKKCVPFFCTDCNLVVSAGCASGKTAIAEAIMGYCLSMNDTSKVVYVSPLKSIGEEKYLNWKAHDTFSKYNIIKVSSEEEISQNDYESARIIVSTIESMDVRSRFNDKWISEVSAIIVDEAHLIGDESRGAGVEDLLMNFSLINEYCRIVCLSGTLANYIEIAKWIKNLNGKETRYVSSSWKPSEVEKKIEIADGYENQMKKIIDISRKNTKCEKKTMLFVHSRKFGENIMKRLNSLGIRAEFYHANLSKNSKKKIICEFKSDYSDLFVLICTSSLSMGVTI